MSTTPPSLCFRSNFSPLFAAAGSSWSRIFWRICKTSSFSFPSSRARRSTASRTSMHLAPTAGSPATNLERTSA